MYDAVGMLIVLLVPQRFTFITISFRFFAVMIFCAAISVAGAVLTQTCITPKSKNSNTRALLDLEGIDDDGSHDDDTDSIVQ